MPLKDYVYIRTREFSTRISEWPDDKLVKEETAAIRQIISVIITGCIGAGTFIPTHGASLAVLPLAGYRLHLAEKKLRLIEAELEKREMSLHELKKRDLIIPLAALLTGALVGGATHGITDHLLLPVSGSSAVDQVIHHAADAGIDAGKGFVHGVEAQVEEVVNAGTAHNPDIGSAGGVGWNCGVKAAQKSEILAAKLIVAEVASEIEATMGSESAKDGVVHARSKGGVSELAKKEE